MYNTPVNMDIIVGYLQIKCVHVELYFPFFKFLVGHDEGSYFTILLERLVSRVLFKLKHRNVFGRAVGFYV